MTAGADVSTKDRAALHDRLERRNRVVGMLRLVVPAAGAVVLGALLLQIVIANIGETLGVDGVSIERDRLVIATPEYSGVMANGTRYTVTAESASAAAGNTDVMDLTDATLHLVRQDGYEMTARAADADFSLGGQTVDVPGLMHVTDSRGMRARLRDTHVDWTRQTLVARESVWARFDDGSVLTADHLVYDAGQQTWDFENTRLVVPRNREDAT